MPPDNFATVAINGAVEFPRNGPSRGGIIRDVMNPTNTFILPAIGTYEITWQVSVDEAGQMALAFDDTGLGFTADPNTVVGRATGTTQIVGMCFFTTSAINTKIQIQNFNSTAALTITPDAGTAAGRQAVSAHVLIKQIE